MKEMQGKSNFECQVRVSEGSSYWESTVHVQCTCIPPALCHLSHFKMGFLHVHTYTYLWEILY